MSPATRALVIAAMIAAYVILLLPLVVVIGASFDGGSTTHLRFPPEALSLRWYENLPLRYVYAFGRSLLISGGAALLATVIGTAAAVCLARSSVAGSAVLRAFFQFPLQIPFVVTGVVFLQFYYVVFDATGFQLVGRYPGLILAHLFFCIPYAVASVGSVITPSFRSVEDAARIAGATEPRVFRRVTLPALMPGIFPGFFYAFILSFGDVPVSVFLASSNMQPLPVEIFQTLQFDYDPAVLSASSLVVLFSVVMIFAFRSLFGVDLVLAGNKKR